MSFLDKQRTTAELFAKVRELEAELDRFRKAFDLASSAFAHEVDGQHAKSERLITAARRIAKEEA